MCFGCSKEPSHRDSSFEYPQHMFWFRNKENNFFIVSHSYLGPESIVKITTPECKRIHSVNSGILFQKKLKKKASKQGINDSHGSDSSLASANNEKGVVSKRHRRPVIPPKPNYSLNLWSIMRNCIGKELSKIPMPVSTFR